MNNIPDFIFSVRLIRFYLEAQDVAKDNTDIGGQMGQSIGEMA